MRDWSWLIWLQLGCDVGKRKQKAQGPEASSLGRAIDTANVDAKASVDRLKSQLVTYRWWIVLFLVVASVWLGLRGQKPAVMTEEEAAICRGDLACWVGHYGSKAEAGCRHVVEAAAKNGAVWDDEGFGKVLTRWHDQGKGSLQLIGDAVRFEDDNGDLTRMSFSCVFDPSSSRVRLTHLDRSE